MSKISKIQGKDVIITRLLSAISVISFFLGIMGYFLFYLLISPQASSKTVLLIGSIVGFLSFLCYSLLIAKDVISGLVLEISLLGGFVSVFCLSNLSIFFLSEEKILLATRFIFGLLLGVPVGLFLTKLKKAIKPNEF